MCDFGSIRTILHQEHLELLDIADHELVPSTREAMPRLLVGAVADVYQFGQALESASQNIARALRDQRMENRLEHFQKRLRDCAIVRQEHDELRNVRTNSEGDGCVVHCHRNDTAKHS